MKKERKEEENNIKPNKDDKEENIVKNLNDDELEKVNGGIEYRHYET